MSWVGSQAQYASLAAPALPEGPLELPPESDTARPIWQLLDTICDPEIPVVSLREMGVLRALRVAGRSVEAMITPTYSGCPAMAQMADDILQTLATAGWSGTVTTALAPAWSTTWMTPSARRKLRDYGIAPPRHAVSACRSAGGTQVVRLIRTAGSSDAVECPRCQSTDTVAIAQFGSTACKALYRCQACLEPFDYFKPY